MSELLRKERKVDVCVVGGGLAGVCAAVAAARHGAKVALMQDRPMLGGNSSSEIRMWVSGAGSRVRNLQETGLIEEILLENMYRNPTRNFSVWDSVLYEKVKAEENIDLLLNCACCFAENENSEIKSVTGFQLTTYTWQKVYADTFIDCSGDSVLAELCDAEYMTGRESKDEFGEEWGLEKPDKKTMGMSIMIQAHETDHKCVFIPPEWAYRYNSDEEMHYKPHDCLKDIGTNFYWIELGGEVDSIHDTEEIRDELLKIAYGVWDHVKNRGDHGADNWDLDFIGFLPGKRESRRYVGDYILTQQDVEAGKAFDDEVAYGGWQIDNHLPGGFNMSGKDGFHLQKKRLTEPYGIPFRSLYSKNVKNLMFAGRNISATHLAFATVRVMATCGVMGQAVGTAAALMTKYRICARELLGTKIKELQNILMDDDCFLPHFKRQISPLCTKDNLFAEWGDAGALLNGVDRKIWGNDNGYFGMANRAVGYTFEKPTKISGFRLIADSDLDREYVEGNPAGLNISATLFRRMDYNYTSFGFPKCMLKSFKVQILDERGEWVTVYHTDKNHQRMIKGQIDAVTTAVRLIPLSTYYSESVINTYGSVQTHIFSFVVV
ncbi:MAG: FAD-dependent oxidoreductase [Clostridia bacterium]|nr:FAD-dependent oxidoreductase [Clostridia bacterium]